MLYADRGYDHDKYRKQVRAAGIRPVIARRGIEHGSGLGAHRWVVEQTFALLHWFRRLRIRERQHVGAALDEERETLSHRRETK